MPVKLYLNVLAATGLEVSRTKLRSVTTTGRLHTCARTFSKYSCPAFRSFSFRASSLPGDAPGFEEVPGASDMAAVAERRRAQITAESQVGPALRNLTMHCHLRL